MKRTNLIFLNESSAQSIKTLAQAHLSKTLGVKEHLKALLAKKIRLELEIKQLQTTIKRRERKNSKEIKLHLSLESEESISTESPLYQILLEESPETIELLRQLDQETLEIKDLFEECRTSFEEVDRLS